MVDRSRFAREARRGELSVSERSWEPGIEERFHDGRLFLDLERSEKIVLEETKRKGVKHDPPPTHRFFGWLVGFGLVGLGVACSCYNKRTYQYRYDSYGTTVTK